MFSFSNLVPVMDSEGECTTDTDFGMNSDSK